MKEELRESEFTVTCVCPGAEDSGVWGFWPCLQGQSWRHRTLLGSWLSLQLWFSLLVDAFSVFLFASSLSICFPAKDRKTYRMWNPSEVDILKKHHPPPHCRQGTWSAGHHMLLEREQSETQIHCLVRCHGRRCNV